MRTLLCLTAAVLLASAGNASAQPFFAGFNDNSGVNSNGTPNSPYNVNGAPLNGQGAGEPGWFAPWQTIGGDVTVVNTGAFEGDGVMRMTGGTAQVVRSLQLPISGIMSVEMQFQIQSSITLGNGVNFYFTSNGLPNGVNEGPVWQASGDGRFRVVDGVENTVGTLEDTPFLWTPGAFQRIRVDVDMLTRTWGFSVNGVFYNPPDPLGFRGSPNFLDSVNFLNGINAPNAVLIDRIYIGPVPEPSSLALAGLASIAGLVRWRHKRTLAA